MGHIESLPDDILVHIFSALEQREACALGCASKTLARVHEITPKAVTVRERDDAVSAARFVDKHATSVYRLFSTGKILNYFVIPRIVSGFSKLRHLKLSWSSVPGDVTESLPKSLETLYVRRIVPPRGTRRGGHVFSTSSIDELGSLKHVSLWFSAMYDEVRLDHSAKFSTLFIAAPTYVKVAAPPGPLASLRIDCNAIWFHEGGGVLEMAPTTKIKTSDFSAPRELFAHSSMHRVETLSYECPSRSWVPYLDEMTNLKRLYVTLDNPVAHLEDFAKVSNLTELVVRARYSFGIADDPYFRGFDRGAKISVYVNGEYSAFHSSALAPS